MWLLSTCQDASSLEESLSSSTEPYAILSHRWREKPEEEVTFGQLRDNRLTDEQLRNDTTRLNSHGWTKILAACEIARENKIKWIWVCLLPLYEFVVTWGLGIIDTCCINKESSAELSEAINSMYAWYRDAKECYAFLDDVPQPEAQEASDQDFRDSKWFKRGWTLQELLAPRVVRFYGMRYVLIGTREELSKKVSTATGIGEEYLGSSDSSRVSIHSASVAERMSWACKRTTSKPEDIAYSLLGIFDVNMALLYGEGEKAFTRLQMEIIAQTTDDSIFAWRIGKRDEMSGMLARLPSDFEGSGGVTNEPDPGQAASQATLNAVVHISMMPLRAALANCLFGVHQPAQDTIRLRCIRRHGRRRFELWLSLQRQKDGKYYRTALSSRSTRWLSVFSITLQQFVRYPKQVSVSSRSSPNPGTVEGEMARPKDWWTYVPATPILQILFALRLLAIALVVWTGITGQPTCSAGTNGCDAAFLVVILVFAFRDLLLNSIQFWAIIALSILVSGTVRFGSRADRATDPAM
ncbi:hypothetical protein LTS10_004011 [Elasticomyces elasticus]|nr:hypothetical protein LTS10_004011 [Elasticomyces elasticus]